MTGAKDKEIALLLSQHLVSKDRPLDDIALHVFEEHEHGVESHAEQLGQMVRRRRQLGRVSEEQEQNAVMSNIKFPA